MNWIKRHPFQAVSFTAFNVFLACTAAYEPHLIVPCTVAFVLGLVVWACLFQIYKPLMVFFLSLLMATSGLTTTEAAEPAQNQADGLRGKKGGEVVVGVIIICVGTYCVYKLARFCKQHFPPPQTNQVNQAEAALPDGNNDTNVYAASFILAADPCSDYGSSNSNVLTNTVAINAVIAYGSIKSALTLSDASQSMEAFMAELNSEGLTVGESYAVNGSSAPPSAVPITMSYGSISNNLAGATHTVIVSGSADLQGWTQLFATTASEGKPFQIQDTMIGHSMFYRLELIK